MAINSISGPFGEAIKNSFGDEEISLIEIDGGACCPETIVQFSNVTETVIGYTSELIQKHGRTPQVEAYYFQVDQDGRFIIAGAYTRKTLIGIPTQEIRVDHGGIESGFIKIT